MLAGLRHHAFIGSDYEERDVDAACAGEHRPDERFVAGYVDDSNRPHAFDGKGSKPKIDRDSPSLFLGKPVGVHAGKRLYESCLPVIDVTSGAEDHAALPPQAPCSQTRKARSSRS